MRNKLKKTTKIGIICRFRNHKKGVLALPWEKVIWWAILFLFALFIFWFYGGLKEMIINIGNSFFK